MLTREPFSDYHPNGVMSAPTASLRILSGIGERSTLMQQRIERLIDEALLHTATLSGGLYVQRRTRRVLSKFAIGAAALAAVGMATATAAAGVGAVGLAGGAVAWYRKREKDRAAQAIGGSPPQVGEIHERDFGKDGAEAAAPEMEPHA